jgi:hypothetical protein
LLAQGQFTESLAAFWNGGCWEDAAYVAEHVLTTDELVRFVKANATPASGGQAKKPDDRADEAAALHWEMKRNLMNLTGRRLVRDGRTAEARSLFDPEVLKNFDAF